MSTVIRDASYNPSWAMLTLTFQDGSRYQYRVSPRIWREYQKAESKGEYFSKNIRGRRARRL